MNQRSTSTRSGSQQGDGKLGCIFWLALLALFGYFAFQMMPVKTDAMDLENFIERRAELLGVSSANPERLRREILRRAEELEIPLDPDNLTVTKTATRVRVECDYTVPIDLLVKKWDWEIEIVVERKTL